jgi:hypothetical protein
MLARRRHDKKKKVFERTQLSYKPSERFREQCSYLPERGIAIPQNYPTVFYWQPLTL